MYGSSLSSFSETATDARGAASPLSGAFSASSASAASVASSVTYPRSGQRYQFISGCHAYGRPATRACRPFDPETLGSRKKESLASFGAMTYPSPTRLSQRKKSAGTTPEHGG